LTAQTREVMNTVGKPGKLGEQVKCVVSVSMLTEGPRCLQCMGATGPLVGGHSTQPTRCTAPSWDQHVRCMWWGESLGVMTGNGIM